MEGIVIVAIVYIVAVTTIVLFSSLVILRDISRINTAKGAVKAKSAEAEPVAEPTKTTESEKAPKGDVSEEETDENAVRFSAAAQSLDEKYLALPSEAKNRYDEIVRYATTKEGSRRYKNAGYEEYKIGKNRLVRIKIKRDAIICELVIPNFEFKNYLNSNRVEAKQASTIIRVVDEPSLAAVKDSMDIAVKAIDEERAYKKEQARLKRNARRRKNRAADTPAGDR